MPRREENAWRVFDHLRSNDEVVSEKLEMLRKT